MTRSDESRLGDPCIEPGSTRNVMSQEVLVLEETNPFSREHERCLEECDRNIPGQESRQRLIEPAGELTTKVSIFPFISSGEPSPIHQKHVSIATSLVIQYGELASSLIQWVSQICWI